MNRSLELSGTNSESGECFIARKLFIRKVHHRSIVQHASELCGRLFDSRSRCKSADFHMETVGEESLARLQGLHRDLINLSESRLANVERLWLELDAHVEEFRQLLQAKPKNEKSRKQLLTGQSVHCAGRRCN